MDDRQNASGDVQDLSLIVRQFAAATEVVQNFTPNSRPLDFNLDTTSEQSTINNSEDESLFSSAAVERRLHRAFIRPPPPNRDLRGRIPGTNAAALLDNMPSPILPVSDPRRARKVARLHLPSPVPSSSSFSVNRAAALRLTSPQTLTSPSSRVNGNSVLSQLQTPQTSMNGEEISQSLSENSPLGRLPSPQSIGPSDIIESLPLPPLDSPRGASPMSRRSYKIAQLELPSPAPSPASFSASRVAGPSSNTTPSSITGNSRFGSLRTPQSANGGISSQISAGRSALPASLNLRSMRFSVDKGVTPIPSPKRDFPRRPTTYSPSHFSPMDIAEPSSQKQPPIRNTRPSGYDGQGSPFPDDDNDDDENQPSDVHSLPVGSLPTGYNGDGSPFDDGDNGGQPDDSRSLVEDDESIEIENVREEEIRVDDGSFEFPAPPPRLSIPVMNHQETQVDFSEESESGDTEVSEADATLGTGAEILPRESYFPGPVDFNDDSMEPEVSENPPVMPSFWDQLPPQPEWYLNISLLTHLIQEDLKSLMNKNEKVDRQSFREITTKASYRVMMPEPEDRIPNNCSLAMATPSGPNDVYRLCLSLELMKDVGCPFEYYALLRDLFPFQDLVDRLVPYGPEDK